MFNIYFGKLGFHCESGSVRYLGSGGDTSEAKMWICFIGIVGFCYWNQNAAKMISRVMRMSFKDQALIANAPRRIEELVQEAVAEERARYERADDSYWKERESTQKLLTEANTRCRDLEVVVKVLTGYRKLPLEL